MRLVRCEECGHENRTALTATTCDRCGADISEPLSAPGQAVVPVEVSAAVRPMVDVAPSVGAAPSEHPAPAEAPEEAEAKPDYSRVVARVAVAALAVSLGTGASVAVHVGSALFIDPYAAGTVAVLAVAAAVSGIVLLVAGSGARRAQWIPFGVRVLGFVLAVVGTLVAVTILREPPRETHSVSPSTMAPMPFAEPTSPRGPSMGSGPRPMMRPPGAPHSSGSASPQPGARRRQGAGSQ